MLTVSWRPSLPPRGLYQDLACGPLQLRENGHTSRPSHFAASLLPLGTASPRLSVLPIFSICKDSRDYVGSPGTIQNNVPILRFLILITSGKSLFKAAYSQVLGIRAWEILAEPLFRYHYICICICMCMCI